jgi:transcriptional regulator with XRE-family HTH domain
MTWSEIRAHFAALHAEARAAGTTQQAIADRGGIAGQNTVSRLLSNDKLGPSVEIFIRAIEGLGKPVSEFFAELEQGRGRSVVSPAAIEASLLSRLQRLEETLEALARSVSSSASSALGSAAQLAPGNREGRPSHDGASISHGVVNHIHIAALDRQQLEAIVQGAAEGIVTKYARLEAEARVAPVDDRDADVPAGEPTARAVDRRRAAEHA